MKLTKDDLDPADFYQPPASRVAEAIQYPIDHRWANRVINAYRADGKSARAALAGEKPDA